MFKNWNIELYKAAVNDASIPEPCETVHNLTVIAEENKLLQWKTLDNVPRVLMVSLTGSPQYYQDYINKAYNSGDYSIWVTANPEVKNICRQAGTGNNLIMRLRQLLGLTPTASISHFVEFYVKPSSLFRPAPDNEINDNTATLNLPENTELWYREWFDNLRNKQYFESKDPVNHAYPWTQLGYTYDWGNPETTEGVSEFVIKKNSDLIVNNIIPIEDYCHSH